MKKIDHTMRNNKISNVMIMNTQKKHIYVITHGKKVCECVYSPS